MTFPPPERTQKTSGTEQQRADPGTKTTASAAAAPAAATPPAATAAAVSASAAAVPERQIGSKIGRTAKENAGSLVQVPGRKVAVLPKSLDLFDKGGDPHANLHPSAAVASGPRTSFDVGALTSASVSASDDLIERKLSSSSKAAAAAAAAEAAAAAVEELEEEAMPPKESPSWPLRNGPEKA